MEEKNVALGVDFKNLMSCIHYHEDSQDNDVIIETLKTIIDICSNESCGQDAFREAGGLDFLVEFLFVTDNTTFLDYTLTTLAFVIDGNVHSQMYMSKRSVFEVLQALLKNQLFPSIVQKNALVLISTILYHNSIAQSLVFEIGLLQDLLKMYEQYSQDFMKNSSMISNLDNSVLNLWMSTNSALCFAVNNPQNEKNQELCKDIFPVCLKILEFSSNSTIMSSVASFLALAISDNDDCKDLFSSYDGFLVLKRCFQKYFDSFLMDLKICNGIIGKETCQAIHNIVGIISSASLDHGSSESNLCCLDDSNLNDILEKSNPEYSNDAIKDNFVLNGMMSKIPSLKQSFTKVPSIYSPSLKSDSRYWKKANSALSTNLENSASDRTKNSRHLNKLSSINKDLSKFEQIARPIKKFSFTRKGLSSSSAVQCNILSDHNSSPRDENFLTNIRSNIHLDASKHKYSEKKLNKASSNVKFSKQDISKNMPFTDFLKKEPKGSNPELKNRNFLETAYSKILSNGLISEWPSYNKPILHKTSELSNNISTKIESFSQCNIRNSSSPHVKVENSTFELERNLRLFKKKKKRESTKQSLKWYSSSSSEYTFAPYIPKNSRIHDNNSDYLRTQRIDTPNQKEMKFTEVSEHFTSDKTNNDQNNCIELNTDSKLQLPIQPFSFKTEKQILKDEHTEFSLQFTPMTFENSLGKDNSFSSCQSIPKIDKESTLDFTHFADGSSLQLKKRSVNSDLSSNFDPQYSKKPDICSEDCYQSVNWRVLQQTSTICENPYKKKGAWSCSSTSTCKESFSPFSSSLNSNSHVQVIVLPNGTCEQHGLSASVEMLEVVSLEDIMS